MTIPLGNTGNREFDQELAGLLFRFRLFYLQDGKLHADVDISGERVASCVPCLNGYNLLTYTRYTHLGLLYLDETRRNLVFDPTEDA